ncbi:hypothetical protein [Arthrobacter sp. MAHUQ-56]
MSLSTASVVSPRSLALEPLQSSDSSCVSALLRGFGQEPSRIDFSANVPLTHEGGSWLPVALFWAMRHGLTLSYLGDVNSTALANAEKAQRLRSFRPQHGSALFAKQNLDAMKTNGIRDQELTAVLSWMVRVAPLWDAARAVKKAIRRR